MKLTVMLNDSGLSFSVGIVFADALQLSLPSALILIPETYRYLSEDITVLKDDPDHPDHFQPTRANMVILLPPLLRAINSDPHYRSVNLNGSLLVPHLVTSSHFSVRLSAGLLTSQSTHHLAIQHRLWPFRPTRRD